MVKFFSQSHTYTDPWPTVTLAFFLRYPNPYASHVLSCDVLSRTPTPQGTLITTRLILKRGAIPKWVPKGMVSRAESWIIEESEVDIVGRVVRCSTKNLDHVKIMSVREDVTLREASENTTIQKTEARVVSQFGWGLAKRIERYGHEKFERNIAKSREGISLILQLLHQSRLQALSYDGYPARISGTGTILDSYQPRAFGTSPSTPRNVEPAGGGGDISATSGQSKWRVPNPLRWFKRPE